MSIHEIHNGGWTEEELEAGLPQLFEKWGSDYRYGFSPDGLTVFYQFGIKLNDEYTEACIVRFSPLTSHVV